MTSVEKESWIRLALSENVGPITFRNLISYFKSAEETIKQLPEMLKKSGHKRPIRLATAEAAQKQLEMAYQIGASILTSAEHDYPATLKEIEDAPPMLFTMGLPALLNHKAIALVGSRNCSINGKNLARRISFDLSENDYVIVSGMARGIDTSAHEGALHNSSKKGGTIAVLGTGIDQIYPKENEALYHEIKERGCLVSELPIGTSPFPSAFPRRNRIISGLAVGTLVIEAGVHSGSLISAKDAFMQKRKVFAIPGSPLDPRSAGPNQLIKEGAFLVENAADILKVIRDEGWTLLDSQKTVEKPSVQPIKDQELAEARKIITERLTPEVTSINQLIRGTGLPTNMVNIILAELELMGEITRAPGGYVALIYNDKIMNKTEK